jgi:hypothetical protein
MGHISEKVKKKIVCVSLWIYTMGNILEKIKFFFAFIWNMDQCVNFSFYFRRFIYLRKAHWIYIYILLTLCKRILKGRQKMFIMHYSSDIISAKCSFIFVGTMHRGLHRLKSYWKIIHYKSLRVRVYLLLQFTKLCERLICTSQWEVTTDG